MDTQATDSWIGRKLGGRYEILEVIGEGGMGIVYSARQISVDRQVAIKMMHTRAAQDPKWSERFQSEAKACSLLTHPNTIRLYDFGKTTLGNFYMVMELLTGRSLSDVIDEQAPMQPGRVLRILMQCCASLAEAHRAGIIHRDIKPDNIFVQRLEGADDFIKLFDFSIAKRSDVQMTATGIIMGTPQFMSPEQGRGETIDPRSDLYSLGIVAYAMLTGRLPFHDEDPLEVLRMHQSKDVPPMPESVPNSVARLVMSCLDKNPARRPASALALLEASKIWLTEIDPSLDVASDPILKNTLIGGGPTEVEHTLPSTPAGAVKTMLDASGAIQASLHGVNTAPPSATIPAAPPIATTPEVAVPPLATTPEVAAPPTATIPVAAVAAPPTATIPVAPAVAANTTSDSQRTSIQEQRSSGTSDSQRTAIQESGSSGVSDSARTLIHGSAPTSDSKRTSIQSPTGPQRSDSDEIRRDEEVRTRRPTNQPTLSNYPRSETPTAQQRPTEAPGQQHPGAPSPVEQPTEVAPAVGPISPLPNQGPGWQEVPADAAPMPMQSGRAGFVFACFLVALTFGFGAYFLTATLR